VVKKSSRVSKFQGFRFKGSKVQRFKGSRVQGFKGIVTLSGVEAGLE
jgi:hypothetical protein